MLEDAHTAPSAVLDCDAPITDGDEVADALPRDLLALLIRRLEMRCP